MEWYYLNSLGGFAGTATKADTCLGLLLKASELSNGGIPQMDEHYITPHFRWDEARCNDGTAVPARYRANVLALARQLEYVRAIWDRPITVLSWYRTPSYNAKVGGATKSQHMLGRAADIVVAGISPADVYAEIARAREGSLDIPDGGLGKYRTFTHIDTGPIRRWNMTNLHGH